MGLGEKIKDMVWISLYKIEWAKDDLIAVCSILPYFL